MLTCTSAKEVPPVSTHTGTSSHLLVHHSEQHVVAQPVESDIEFLYENRECLHSDTLHLTREHSCTSHSVSTHTAYQVTCIVGLQPLIIPANLESTTQLVNEGNEIDVQLTITTMSRPTNSRSAWARVDQVKPARKSCKIVETPCDASDASELAKKINAPYVHGQWLETLRLSRG